MVFTVAKIKNLPNAIKQADLEPSKVEHMFSYSGNLQKIVDTAIKPLHKAEKRDSLAKYFARALSYEHNREQLKSFSQKGLFPSWADSRLRERIRSLDLSRHKAIPALKHMAEWARAILLQSFKSPDQFRTAPENINEAGPMQLLSVADNICRFMDTLIKADNLLGPCRPAENLLNEDDDLIKSDMALDGLNNLRELWKHTTDRIRNYCPVIEEPFSFATLSNAFLGTDIS